MGTPVLRPPLCRACVCVRPCVRQRAVKPCPSPGPNKRAAIKAPVMQRSVS